MDNGGQVCKILYTEYSSIQNLAEYTEYSVLEYSTLHRYST